MTQSKRSFAQFKKDLVELMGENYPDSAENDIYSDMLYNIGLLKAEQFDISELRLLNTAFKELRYALKVFKVYRTIPKAAVFGSARTPKNHPNYKHAKDFAKRLAKKGWMVITGGASGIMEAAMEGAGTKKSFGLNILLPFEQQANPIIQGNHKLIFFKYFFTRKLMFLKESEATVLFPGGFGTFDEGFESFTLVQTGKAKPRPIVLIDSPGSQFWEAQLKYFKNFLVKDRLISKNDLFLLNHFQQNQPAADYIVGFYKNYDSSRFFRDQYLIRLKKSLSIYALQQINHEFKDILSKGQFEVMQDPQEDDNKNKELERLQFSFDRSSYARLKQLVDHLNRL